jgi:hypothetical protein
MIGRERNLARPDQVDGDLADAVGRSDRELVERFDVAGDADDETVHHVFFCGRCSVGLLSFFRHRQLCPGLSIAASEGSGVKLWMFLPHYPSEIRVDSKATGYGYYR